MVEILLAGVLLLISAAILWYLGALVVNAAGLPLGALLAKWHFRRYLAHAHSADRFIGIGDVDSALREIRRAFYLRPVVNNEIAALVAKHHTGLLSRILALTAENHGGGVRLLSLAKVDHLLGERAALQRRLVAVRQGAPLSHRTEVETRLSRNGNELGKALAQLAVEVSAAQPREMKH